MCRADGGAGARRSLAGRMAVRQLRLVDDAEGLEAGVWPDRAVGYARDVHARMMRKRWRTARMCIGGLGTPRIRISVPSSPAANRQATGAAHVQGPGGGRCNGLSEFVGELPVAGRYVWPMSTNPPSSRPKTVSLSELAPGVQAEIVKLGGKDAINHRLRELGFCEASRVTKIAGRSTVMCEVSGTKLALGQELARLIRVLPLIPPGVH